MAKNVADEHPTSSNKLLMNHISHISIFFGVAKPSNMSKQRGCAGTRRRGFWTWRPSIGPGVFARDSAQRLPSSWPSIRMAVAMVQEKWGINGHRKIIIFLLANHIGWKESVSKLPNCHGWCIERSILWAPSGFSTCWMFLEQMWMWGCNDKFEVMIPNPMYLYLLSCKLGCTWITRCILVKRKA